jgi:hypothetical protein
MMETDIMVGTAMKLTCSKEDFVSSLGIVSRAVSTRSSVQILAGVLLQASAGELRLAATDMELSLRTSLEAQVEDECSVACAARRLPRSILRGCFRTRRCRSSIVPTGVLKPRLRRGELPAAHVQRRGLPSPARDRRHADLQR